MRCRRNHWLLYFPAHQPHEGEMASVRRPTRIKIPISAGRGVAQRGAAKFVNDDKAVIAAIADERNLLPVGRPPGLRVVASREGQRFGFGLCIVAARNW